MLIQTGLVSVTFRTLATADVVRTAVSGAIDAIEWSGDTHVPAGKVRTAERVGQITREAGLKVAAYGSYYRVGHESTTMPINAVLDTASALGAPIVRVFAGDVGSKVAREHVWRKVTGETQRIADQAKNLGISISFEFQANTLNDMGTSSRRLLEAIDRENVYTYWQPDARLLLDEQLEGLDTIVDYVSNVHVFHWTKGRRMALSDGENDWRHYLARLRRTRREHLALLEFVQDDLPANFERDAATLRHIIDSLPHRKE